mgnify:CR=1 FL=1
MKLILKLLPRELLCFEKEEAPEEKSTFKKTIEKKESCLGEGQDHGFDKNLDGSKELNVAHININYFNIFSF